MIKASGLVNKYWGEAMMTATYLRNRCPTKALSGMTPFEAWFEEKPDLSHLRTFGCEAYTHIPDVKRRKLDSKCEKRIFVGYQLGTKGYRLLDPNTDIVILSRDVIFHEQFTEIEDTMKLEIKQDELMTLIDISNQKEVAQEPVSLEISAQPRRSGRVNKGKPPNRYDSKINTANLALSEPLNWTEAMNQPESEKWMQAAKEEIKSLNENKTWEIVDLPEGRKPIPCKWVFKIKCDDQGIIQRYKARLVAKGFAQKAGLDYEKTFSPVVSFNSIRTLLAIAAYQNLEVEQMDVTTAFLNGELKEEIYMCQPEAGLFCFGCLARRYC